MPFSRLCGLPWNCQDTLPRYEYDQIRGMADTPPTGSYGAAARWMKAEIVRQLARQQPVERRAAA